MAAGRGGRRGCQRARCTGSPEPRRRVLAALRLPARGITGTRTVTGSQWALTACYSEGEIQGSDETLQSESFWNLLVFYLFAKLARGMRGFPSLFKFQVGTWLEHRIWKSDTLGKSG